MTESPINQPLNPGPLGVSGDGMAELVSEAFQGLPYGIVVFDGEGTAVAWNERAVDLLGPIEPHLDCCSLIGCGGPGSPLGSGCFSELARERSEPLPETRVDLPEDRGARAVWLTAARIEKSDRTLLHVRPGDPGDRRRRTVPHWVAEPQLRIYALGGTRVLSRESALTGRWLEGRAGQILKFLVAERRRVVQTDEVVEAIWPNSDISARTSVRYYIHNLREKIEPKRPKRGEGSFVVSRNGGYTLDLSNVWVDVETFERRLTRGLAALHGDDEEVAVGELREALAMYTGEFLDDEPYARWAIPERDRLRNLASDGLRGLARVSVRRGDLDQAMELTSRLAKMQPFDEDVQRRAIAMALASGRRSDALRHYSALRTRISAEFDEEPSFEFGDVRGDEIFAD